MTISDERFELNMQGLEADGLAGTAAELRARDTAQREAIERLQGEMDEYISSVPGIENQRDNLREALARVEAERDAVLAKAPTPGAYDQTYTALHKHRELANTAQALLREVDAYLSGHGDNAICNGSRLHRDIKDLLAGQIAVAGTTSDQYRAELYDEVWQKARDMGYGNVSEALVALERTKAGAGEPMHQWADGILWQDSDEAELASARAEGFKTHTLWTSASAAAHGDELVAVVGTVPDGSGFKSLDFKVDLKDLPDGTRLYAQVAGVAST